MPGGGGERGAPAGGQSLLELSHPGAQGLQMKRQRPVGPPSGLSASALRQGDPTSRPRLTDQSREVVHDS
jgi:hypothetical protein